MPLPAVNLKINRAAFLVISTVAAYLAYRIWQNRFEEEEEDHDGSEAKKLKKGTGELPLEPTQKSDTEKGSVASLGKIPSNEVHAKEDKSGSKKGKKRRRRRPKTSGAKSESSDANSKDTKEIIAKPVKSKEREAKKKISGTKAQEVEVLNVVEESQLSPQSSVNTNGTFQNSPSSERAQSPMSPSSPLPEPEEKDSAILPAAPPSFTTAVVAASKLHGSSLSPVSGSVRGLVEVQPDQRSDTKKETASAGATTVVPQQAAPKSTDKVETIVQVPESKTDAAALSNPVTVPEEAKPSPGTEGTTAPVALPSAASPGLPNESPAKDTPVPVPSSPRTTVTETAPNASAMTSDMNLDITQRTDPSDSIQNYIVPTPTEPGKPKSEEARVPLAPPKTPADAAFPPTPEKSKSEDLPVPSEQPKPTTDTLLPAEPTKSKSEETSVPSVQAAPPIVASELPTAKEQEKPKLEETPVPTVAPPLNAEPEQPKSQETLVTPPPLPETADIPLSKSKEDSVQPPVATAGIPTTKELEKSKIEDSSIRKSSENPASTPEKELVLDGTQTSEPSDSRRSLAKANKSDSEERKSNEKPALSKSSERQSSEKEMTLDPTQRTDQSEEPGTKTANAISPAKSSTPTKSDRQSRSPDQKQTSSSDSHAGCHTPTQVSAEMDEMETQMYRQSKTMRHQRCYCRAKRNSMKDDEFLFNPNERLQLEPTEIHPVEFCRYKPTNLIEPILDEKTELSEPATEPPPVVQESFMTVFHPLLHAITYAHQHANLIEELIQNRDYLD